MGEERLRKGRGSQLESSLSSYFTYTCMSVFWNEFGSLCTCFWAGDFQLFNISFKYFYIMSFKLFYFELDLCFVHVLFVLV